MWCWRQWKTRLGCLCLEQSCDSMRGHICVYMDTYVYTYSHTHTHTHTYTHPHTGTHNNVSIQESTSLLPDSAVEILYPYKIMAITHMHTHTHTHTLSLSVSLSLSLSQNITSPEPYCIPHLTFFISTIRSQIHFTLSSLSSWMSRPRYRSNTCCDPLVLKTHTPTHMNTHTHKKNVQMHTHTQMCACAHTHTHTYTHTDTHTTVHLLYV